MLIVLGTLLAVLAGFLVVRLLWRARRSAEWGTVFAILAAALVIGLAALAATGRLSWIAAVAAALLPFLRRLWGLVGYLPLFRRLFGEYQTRTGRPGSANARKTQGGQNPAGMSRDRALEILGLGPHPTREEIVGAHRRLIQKVHPDRGGTNFLAQQLNDAKKLLLDELETG